MRHEYCAAVSLISNVSAIKAQVVSKWGRMAARHPIIF